MRRLHLQAAIVVLRQQGEQAIVRMFANTPPFCGVGRRIVEDAEQHGGLRGVGPAEVLRIETEAERDAFHDARGRSFRPASMKAVTAVFSSGTADGNRFAAMQRQTGPHARIVRAPALRRNRRLP